jgi:hypothetical protein
MGTNRDEKKEAGSGSDFFLTRSIYINISSKKLLEEVQS